VAGAVARLGVVPDAVNEDEQVAEAPAAGMFEGEGLLPGRIDLEVDAVEVGEAVVLPQQQIAGQGLAAEKGGGQAQASSETRHLQLRLSRGDEKKRATLPALPGLCARADGWLARQVSAACA